MSWMQTYTGKKFYVSEPEKTDFCLDDIGHSLSNQCRFGGHTKEFYSVAQHSVFVADIVKISGGDLIEELWGLMHDATEAYMVDIPTPLKITLAGYEERENELMKLIARDLGFPPHGEESLLPLKVKIADRVAVVTEARQLTHGTKEWSAAYHAVASFPIKITPLPPKLAEKAFIERYHAIRREIWKR